MTAAGFQALLPWLVVAAGAMATLLITSAKRLHGVVAGTAAATLAIATATLGQAWSAPAGAAGPLLVVDGFTVYFVGLVLLASIAVVWLAHGWLAHQAEQREEFYTALLLSTLGAMTLIASHHLAALFLGLELLSVGLFVMAAYLRDSPIALEAGFKYLVLASVSSAFLVFAIALLYAATGTLEIPAIAAALSSLAPADWKLAIAGLGLVLVAVGFKLALVPFHLWAPDVYEGAPTPSTAYLASVSKAAMLAIVVRAFIALRDQRVESVLVVIGTIAVASMLAGNLLGLFETRIKRLLAYSSISHLGYAMLALLISGPAAVEAAAFYMTAYLVTVIAAFGVIAVLEPETGDTPTLEAYRGLLWRRPVLGAILMAAMLSLAGIPLTAGFVAKFLLLVAGVEAGLWIPVFALVLGSAIGVFYYLRVVVALFSRSAAEEAALARAHGAHAVATGHGAASSGAAPLGASAAGASSPSPMPVSTVTPDAAPTRAVAVPWGAGLVLVVLAVLVIWLGTWPAPFLRLIESSVLVGL
jgi:NADH-quinone oxidoreductase subunit N